MKKIISYGVAPVAAIFGLFLTVAPVHAGDINKIYKDTCELCHGPDGKGSEAGKGFGVPDFSSAEYQKSRTDADMKKSMTEGTKNPNYIKLSDLDVDAASIDPLIKKVREFCK